MNRCPALLVSASASGQGKTLVTAALARHYRNQGLRVGLFKVGPDFLDPLILERASGTPVYQIDLWLVGEAGCRELLARVAAETDLILVEGAMGLYDGAPSSADLAAFFGIPVLAVIDAAAMAQTFGAVATGLRQYSPSLPFAGVLANRVAGEGHYRMLESSLPTGLPAWGWLPAEPGLSLPERHLGLWLAEEIEHLDEILAQAARALCGVPADLPPAVDFSAPPHHSQPPLLAGVRIAVARDRAFCFLYRANLELLRDLGAELHFFSPLDDTELPPADALYLPGGYPELHAAALTNNRSMLKAVRVHHAAGRPLLAECGGLLYLGEELVDTAGGHHRMAGLLPARAEMRRSLTALALQEVELAGARMRGHTFHHSRLESALQPVARGRCPNGGTTAEAVYRVERLTASYIHFYFPSNPAAVAALFRP